MMMTEVVVAADEMKTPSSDQASNDRQNNRRTKSIMTFSKFILLASIAVTAAVDDDSLELPDAYDCIEQGFLDSIINTDLIAMLPQLNTLSADNLLGLCEALISQLRYTKEVK